MNWRFWSSPPDGVAPAEPPKAPKTVPDLDLAALLAEPHPHADDAPQAGPSYLDGPDEPPSRDRKGSEWTRVNHRELRRQREAREARSGFWARLRRGEVSTADVPGQAAASGVFVGLAQKLLSPLTAIAENPGVVTGVLLTALAFGVLAMGIMEAVHWQFGDIMGPGR